MKLAKLKAVGIAAGVAALSFITTPASAVGGVTISDVMPYWPTAVGNGVDYDAACQVDTSPNPPPPNNIGSPGAGCPGVTTYDGSTELTDFVQVDLETIALVNPPHSDVKIRGLFHVDGPIPPAGSTATADLPNASFAAFSYRVMYQNTTRQTNLVYVAGTRIGTNTPIYGLNEHWQDGFHRFVAFEAAWVGTHWMHSASVGTYDPGPDGAFFFNELGVSNSPGVWNDADPVCMPHGSTWNVTYPTATTVYVEVDGVTRSSNAQAVGSPPCINDEYVKAGDNIVNVKGLSTADSTVTLPVTIPLSLIPGFSDITTLGGFLFFSDTTLGNSRNVGTLGTLLATGDLPSPPSPSPCHNEGQGNRLCQPYSSGAVGLVDTLGDGPRCWTPTFGGLVPPNPLHVSNQPCYIDDDVIPGPSGNIDPGIGRGSIFQEWWDTAFGFTA